MAIYNIDDFREEGTKASVKNQTEISEENSTQYLKDQIKGFAKDKPKGRLFSSITARFFFFLLLIADIVWGIYAMLSFIIKFAINLMTLFMIRPLVASMKYSWLSIKRAIICLIALALAIFSPALGIMFACLYFLMYDKKGVEEIVPSSLRDQFKDFFPS
ncbi:MAG: hypothetical protein K9M07_00520 [Simkaniaceae bacterium]|nr:hypothetical protein [Simkaniaceae bacterium]